jgi:LysR family transcriptional regulator, chromosome initiation inhibitor
LLNREQLETFATVVDVGSFERAATVLNVTRGAISQRVKALEESVASVLLIRERPVIPTAAGELLLRHVKALRLLEGSVLSALVPDEKGRNRVPLAISVNADSLATWFPGVLWPLLQAQRIALEVVSDDQAHTQERLARGEVIGCVSTEAKPANGFLAEPLGSMEYRCVAEPAYARRHFPDGITVPGVLEAVAVLFNRKDSLHDDFLASLFGFRVERYARHYLPAPATLLEGVRAGIGYGLVPALQLGGAPASDGLVDLAPQHAVTVPLYWHHWEEEPPLSRDITRQVVAAASSRLSAPAAAGC